MIASKSPCAASSFLTKSGEKPTVLIEDIKAPQQRGFLLAELLAQLGAGHLASTVVIQVLAQLQQTTLTGRCGDATERAESGLGNGQGTVSTQLCQLFADQHAIAALQNPNRCHNDWIAKIIQNLLAELQQFAVFQAVGPEAEQLQAGKSVQLAWVMQAILHHRFRNFGAPTGERLDHHQVGILIFRSLFELSQQPIAGLALVA